MKQEIAVADLAPHIRAELARRSLVEFSAFMDPTYERARHLDVLGKHLEAVERGEIDRLIIGMPVRHGKSRTCAIDFTAWALGRKPRREIVLASHAAMLAEKHSRAARDLVSHERYPFATEVSRASSSSELWQTTAGGVVRAVGVDGALTGLGGDFLIIDDAFSGANEAASPAIRETIWTWYTTVAQTRLAPKGARILIGTRWHEDDLLGRILNSAGASLWTTLILPALAEENDPLGRAPGEALWPERFPPSRLPSIELGEISSRDFAAVYQQRPVPATGGLFKTQWFADRYTEVPRPYRRRYDDALMSQIAGTAAEDSRMYGRSPIVTAGIDCSTGSGVGGDFSAIVTVVFDGIRYYVSDVVRGRWEFTELVRQIRAAYIAHSHNVMLVEAASSGHAIIQVLESSTNLPVVSVRPNGSKIARAEAFTGSAEAGRIRLPRHAPWLDYFLTELTSFPAARHDDCVDAFIYALRGATLIWNRRIVAERNAAAIEQMYRR